MVTGPQGRGVLAMGGQDSDHQYRKEIYRFQCLYDSLSGCQWQKVDQALKQGRSFHTVIPIQDSTALEICMRYG